MCIIRDMYGVLRILRLLWIGEWRATYTECRYVHVRSAGMYMYGVLRSCTCTYTRNLLRHHLAAVAPAPAPAATHTGNGGGRSAPYLATAGEW